MLAEVAFEVGDGVGAVVEDGGSEGGVGFAVGENFEHLPPGWKLLAAGGVDNVRKTWLKRWCPSRIYCF